MKIATWNINGVRTRAPRLVSWLQRAQPDVLCLQETRCLPEAFPWADVEAVGYRGAAHGEKGRNGVAILAREPLSEVTPIALDPQARLIGARVGEVEVLCAYAPSGGEVGSPKWRHKLAWYAGFSAWLAERSPEQPLVLAGDLNVAPTELDCGDPAAWAGSAATHPDARAALSAIEAWGLTDTLRLHVEGRVASWWDYRSFSFAKDNGLRIDFVSVTPSLAARCTAAWIDKAERRKGRSPVKPSDHVPVLAEFANQARPARGAGRVR